MLCPYCNHDDSRVTDSRSVDRGIKRRRQCMECNSRFTTYERVENGHMAIVKKDLRREDFDQEKLLRGIMKACEKRPLPTGTLTKMVDEIETDLHHQGKSETPSSVIGQMVMDRLLKIDHIAYIRFASVYRCFADIGSLKKEVDTIVDTHDIASQLPLIDRQGLGALSTE